jgi:hypothetical protein
MIKFFRKIRLFNDYRRNVIANKKYLNEKFGLEVSWIYELYTTITLVDAPEDLKQKYGSALAEHEIKKYIESVNASLPKLGLEELVNVYEIKRLNKDNFGIAFGFSLYNNTKLMLLFIGAAVALFSLLTLIIL